MDTHHLEILRIPSPSTTDFNLPDHSFVVTSPVSGYNSEYESPPSTPSSVQTSAFVSKQKKDLIEAAKELMRKNGQNPDDYGPWDL